MSKQKFDFRFQSWLNFVEENQLQTWLFVLCVSSVAQGEFTGHNNLAILSLSEEAATLI